MIQRNREQPVKQEPVEKKKTKREMLTISSPKEQVMQLAVPSADFYPLATISPDYLRCFVGDVTLAINQTIDYIGTADSKSGVGQIKEFMYAGLGQSDKSSAWMKISEVLKDKQSKDNSDWVPVNVWFSQQRDGLFANQNFTTNVENNKPPVVRKPAF